MSRWLVLYGCPWVGWWVLGWAELFELFSLGWSPVASSSAGPCDEWPLRLPGKGFGGLARLSSSGNPVVAGDANQAEHGQPCEVDRGGEEAEVGVDAVGAADPGSSSAVFAAHQVPELAFDLGSGGPVVGDPGRVGLPGPGVGQCLLVRADADRAPGLGGGALRAQRAPGAGLPEVGDAATVAVAGRRIGAVTPAGQVAVSRRGRCRSGPC